MQSNDSFITVEMFDNGIQEIKTEIIALNKKIDGVQNELQEMKQEIKDTRNELLTEIRLNQRDIAHLQTSVYWGFAIVGIVIGLASFVIAIIALLPYLKKEKSEVKAEQKNSPTFEDVNNIVDMAIGKALAGFSR